jgi:hypothetical protein
LATIGLALNEKAQPLKEPPQVATQRDQVISPSTVFFLLVVFFSVNVLGKND